MSTRLPTTLLVTVAALLSARPAASQPGPDCESYLTLLESGSVADEAAAWAVIRPFCEAEYGAWSAREVTGGDWGLETATTLVRWARHRAERDGDCVGALIVLGEVARWLETLPEALAPAFVEASRAAFVCSGAAAARVAPELTETGLDFAGVSGGTQAASGFGASCAGYVAERPGHVFEVTHEQVVNVLARAHEPGDLTLVVTGPGGTWCNDDSYGFNPAVSARLEPGRYSVFVGEDQADQSTRYALRVSTEALPALAFGSQRFGRVPLPLESDAVVLEGTSEGELDAGLLGPDCAGRIAGRPDFLLELASDVRVSLEVTPVRAEDLTLVVVGSGTVRCNDDIVDRNPALSTWLAPGQYAVWVGHKGALPVAYHLRLSADDLFGVEPGALTPGFGAGALDPSGRRLVELAGVATGEEEARTRFGPACAGFISFEPNHTLYVERDAPVWLDAGPGTSTPPGHAGADFETGDLTLIVTGPGGTFCNDDYRGRDPGLAVALAAGTYDVFVGERTLTPSGTSYGLRAGLDEPTGPIGLPAPAIAASPGDPAWHGWGLAFGEVPAAPLGASCVGSVPRVAPWRLTLSAPADVRVEANAGLLGDLVVALNGPGGPVCSVESGALATLEATLAAGGYDLYVGERYGTALGTPYAVTVRALAGGSATRPLAPLAPPGETLEIAIDAVLGLATAPGLSGGPVSARAFGAACVGHVPERPQVAVDIAEAGRYRLAVVAAGDTTLVVDGPGGPWCNDDAVDFNPVVEAELAAGRYLVSVGSYSPRLQHEFVLWVSRATPGAP